MAKKTSCPEPGCAGKIINGVCSECEKRKQTATAGGHGSVGFGMSATQRKPSPPGRGRGGWFN